ncbi:MAG: hypothetical protein GX116_04360 [Fibrobacter sp.]|jgi:predicted  nucleic acid-binding Zn-ribbon protein|nr:hypothetical protein [Fibrobacter sp.]
MTIKRYFILSSLLLLVSCASNSALAEASIKGSESLQKTTNQASIPSKNTDQKLKEAKELQDLDKTDEALVLSQEASLEYRLALAQNEQKTLQEKHDSLKKEIAQTEEKLKKMNEKLQSLKGKK